MPPVTFLHGRGVQATTTYTRVAPPATVRSHSRSFARVINCLQSNDLATARLFVVATLARRCFAWRYCVVFLQYVSFAQVPDDGGVATAGGRARSPRSARPERRICREYLAHDADDWRSGLELAPSHVCYAHIPPACIPDTAAFFIPVVSLI